MYYLNKSFYDIWIFVLLGNMMTLSYTTGLTIGSILAYLMDACLGPPLQAKDVCTELMEAETTTTAFGNITASVLTTAISSTLPAIERTTAIPKLRTTASVLTTVLTSTLLSNSTMSVLSGGGLLDASTTALPKILTNATISASNAILQH